MLAAQFTPEGITAEGAGGDWKSRRNLSDLVGHFESLNEAARLTSEASLRHYRGEFAAQAGIERELGRALGRLHDQSDPFARCVN